MTDWLQSLKVGDEVAVRYRNGFEVLTIQTESKSNWFFHGGVRANKRTGLTCFGFRIEPFSESMREQIVESKERGELRVRLYELNHRKYSLDQLRRIVAILDERGEP